MLANVYYKGAYMGLLLQVLNVAVLSKSEQRLGWICKKQYMYSFN